jgi:hypothetical protein
LSPCSYAARITSVDELSIKQYQGDLASILRCCPRLTWLGIDSHGLSAENAGRILDRRLPRTLRTLAVYHPWAYLSVLEDWIEDEGSTLNSGALPSLEKISMLTWDEWFERAEEPAFATGDGRIRAHFGEALVEVLRKRNAQGVCRVEMEMPSAYWDWVERNVHEEAGEGGGGDEGEADDAGE